MGNQGPCLCTKANAGVAGSSAGAAALSFSLALNVTGTAVDALNATAGSSSLVRLQFVTSPTVRVDAPAKVPFKAPLVVVALEFGRLQAPTGQRAQAAQAAAARRPLWALLSSRTRRAPSTLVAL